MRSNGDRNIEELLGSAKLKPVPPGLREKVLRAAAGHKEARAWTTPLLRWGFVGCAAVLLAIFLADGVVSRDQRSRLQALFAGAGPERNQADEASRLLVEIYGESVAGKDIVKKELGMARRPKLERLRPQDRVRELLKEDFDGSQGAESNH
ncbi:MAG TPA: hypothetical protein VEG35_04680 [Burkholderiales bacterium]|nr:hypothetical protein [Burkholderiales bacterium]